MKEKPSEQKEETDLPPTIARVPASCQEQLQEGVKVLLAPGRVPIFGPSVALQFVEASPNLTTA